MKSFILRAALITSCLFINNTATASQYIADTISIKGNKRVPNESIIYYLGIEKGQTYSYDEIDSMVKRAYTTDFFKEISINYNNKTITINVKEQPVVESVLFFGNKKLNDKDLKEIIKLKAGNTLSDTKLKYDTEDILTAYKRKGFYNVIINPKVVDNSHGSVKVVYEIREGKKAIIRKISFTPTKSFSESELKDNIISKEWAFYRFFSSSYMYDPHKSDADVEITNEYCQSHGYPYAKVVDVVTELDASKEAFNITYVLNVGNKYSFGNVQIKNNIKNIKQSDLNKAIVIKKGKLFSATEVKKSVNNITNLLATHGYAFAEIEQRLEPQPDNTINVIIEVKPTKKFFINKININDNIRTKDAVIRRGMQIGEGDSFDQNKIERSIHLIRNLGYFSDVKVTPKQIGESDKVDLNLSVKEKKTGQAFFNVGYNTITGPMIGANFSESNLLGTGRIVSTGFQFGKVDTSANLSLSEPYFMGFDALSGITLFYNKQTTKQLFTDPNIPDKTQETKYKSLTYGFMLSTRYNLAEYVQHEVQYSLRNEKIGKATTNISPFLSRDEGNFLISSVNNIFSYDRTDNISDPTKGYVLSFGEEVAGLGGNAKFLRTIVSGAYYKPIYKNKVILKLSAQAGNITGIGKQQIRVLDNFYSTDTMIRGFDYNGIGPRDAVTLDALGGKNYAIAKAEMRFPLGLPEEVDVKGVAFFDTAMLHKIDVPVALQGVPYYDSSKIRASYGAGVLWNSPLGMIGFSYGIPVAKTNFDQVKRFNLSFGSSF